MGGAGFEGLQGASELVVSQRAHNIVMVHQTSMHERAWPNGVVQ